MNNPIRLFRILLSACLLAALLGLHPLTGGLQIARADAAFTVTESSDGPDSHVGDGTCTDGVNGCTLRAAIQEAFDSSGNVTITFSPALSGGTILLQNAYGTIVWSGSHITVDGGSQNITIDGQNLNAGYSVLQIRGSSNTLSNLTIKNSRWDGIQVGDFAGVGEGNNNLISQVAILNSTAGGVYVHGSTLGGNGNQVMNSSIGATFAAGVCSADTDTGIDGIYMDGGADNTMISGNKIVCSGGYGIYLNGASGGAIDHTQINTNRIGNTGSIAMGNGLSGVLADTTTNTSIAGNNISGNLQHGVWLKASTYALIRNNLIGTNNMGDTALPNFGDGIHFSDASSDNTVGETLNRNIISGNGADGVSMWSGSVRNTLDRNVIGLNADGTAALHNGQAGVAIYDSSYNNIGVDTGGQPLLIGGNAFEGIYITNGDHNVVGKSTYIGVGSDLTTLIGNNLQGVRIHTGSANSIHPSAVVGSGGAGIIVDEAPGNVGNSYMVGKIVSNGGLPFDLGNDGATLNGAHSGPGPNNWINYPVISAASARSISGTACAGCTVHAYSVLANPVQNGGGGTYSPLAPATASTAGEWSFSLPLGTAPTSLSFVACSPSGDCSEMSPVYAGSITYNIYLAVAIK